MQNNYRISIPNKVKKVPLPPRLEWDRAMDASPSTIFGDFANVEIVNYKRLFKRCVNVGAAWYVISTDGYIVIYKERYDTKGYVFDLTCAKSMYVKEKVVFRGKTTKMKVVIKWKFGELTLRLYDDFKRIERVFREAFLKPNTSSVFHVDANREVEPDDDTDYYDDYDKADESDDTVAIPFTFSIPLLGGRANDLVEVTISSGDEQVDAILASISNTADGLTMVIPYQDGN